MFIKVLLADCIVLSEPWKQRYFVAEAMGEQFSFAAEFSRKKVSSGATLAGACQVQCKWVYNLKRILCLQKF